MNDLRERLARIEAFNQKRKAARQKKIAEIFERWDQNSIGLPDGLIEVLSHDCESDEMPIFETEQEDDGRWICEITNRPGIMAYGETPGQAIQRASELAVEVDSASTTECIEKSLRKMDNEGS